MHRADCAVKLSLATFCILFNGGCGKPGAQGAVRTTPPSAVVVETAERHEVPIMAELAARTRAVATVEIRANVEGRLTEMSFRSETSVGCRGRDRRAPRSADHGGTRGTDSGGRHSGNPSQRGGSAD